MLQLTLYSYVATNLSVNAITADGSAHGQMDQSTATGLPPSRCAQQLLEAVVCKQREVLIASSLHKAAVWLEAAAPSLLFRFIQHRSRRELQALQAS